MQELFALFLCGNILDDMEEKFLGRNIKDFAPEWVVQAYIVQQARKSGLLVHGSQEQGKRSPATAAKAKAMGLTAGVPDLFFWLRGGIKPVELKTVDGKKSPSQEKFHEEAENLGIKVHTIYADSPQDGWSQVKEWLWAGRTE